MDLIAHFPSITSCYAASSVGHQLLLTSYFPEYNQVCLKLYWCLVDSGPFWHCHCVGSFMLCCSFAPQKLAMRLKANFAILPNLLLPWLLHVPGPCKNQQPWPSTHDLFRVLGELKRFSPFSALPSKLSAAVQSDCPRLICVWLLMQAGMSSVHMKITLTILASDTVWHRDPIAMRLDEEPKAHSHPKHF